MRIHEKDESDEDVSDEDVNVQYVRGRKEGKKEARRSSGNVKQ